MTVNFYNYLLHSPYYDSYTFCPLSGALISHTHTDHLHAQVVIVGNGAVGKSSMIQKYCKGIFTDHYKKTIGVDFLEKRI